MGSCRSEGEGAGVPLWRTTLAAVVLPLLLAATGCSWVCWVEIRAALQGVTAAQVESVARADSSVLVRSVHRTSAAAAPGAAPQATGIVLDCDVGKIAVEVSVEGSPPSVAIRAYCVNCVPDDDEAGVWRACVDRLGERLRAAHPATGPWVRDEELRAPADRPSLLRTICVLCPIAAGVVGCAAVVLWRRGRKSRSAAAGDRT
jgi:hypothetical protein